MRPKNPACYILLLLKLFSCTLFSLIKMIHSTSFLNRTGASDSTYSYFNNIQKIHESWVKNRSLSSVRSIFYSCLGNALGFYWITSCGKCWIILFLKISEKVCLSGLQLLVQTGRFGDRYYLFWNGIPFGAKSIGK